jgi:hypothetical protein
MSETITKLRPDRDLQCYFQMPSAVAALSETSATGFTVSGSWRQQFDWAVVEWNRDNVFEHPQLRNLPDGDLSGIVLSYQERRVNCIPVDSNLARTVDWPSLRIWADAPDPVTGQLVEQMYKVPLWKHVSPASDDSQQAYAAFTLTGSPTQGDLIELAWDDEHYNYTMGEHDSFDHAVNNIAYAINQNPNSIVSASIEGATIRLTVKTGNPSYSGANGNRLGAYGNVFGSGVTEAWSPVAQQFIGGQSTSTWSYSFDFSKLYDETNALIPTNNIRVMRWTYAADLQKAAYERSEFSVTVSNWSVTGSNLTYSVAGPGSRRIEDTSSALVYSTTNGVSDWQPGPGNFSGGTIHCTAQPSATCTYEFTAEREFAVYVGTRRGYGCATITITLDGVAGHPLNLLDPLLGDDVLIRLPAGTVQPGNHTLVIQHTGGSNTNLYLDFIDLAVPTQDLPSFPVSPTTTLATDWDTLHSIALAPERTAWLINKLGFTGRANHYTGALWFYELVRVGHVYATGTIQFRGTAAPNWCTSVFIGFAGSSLAPSEIKHLHLYSDDTSSIAKAFELRINSGYTSIWATADGPMLTLQSRMMGADGNNITMSAVTTPPQDADVGSTSKMTIAVSGSQLSGGVDGEGGGVGDLLAAPNPDDKAAAAYAAANRGWRTDLTATPRINRACRDWSRSFFRALKTYGIPVTAAFSTELQHGDPALAAGIAQRYPSGAPVTLTTPALQTNFSPTSCAFWQQMYADMAQVMEEAGQTPYLQFGEVQWWYFPYDGSGLPFYDDYTKAQFAAKYNQTIGTITSNSTLPADFPLEAEFLSALIGAHTRSIQQFVRQTHPTARFEVLYPCDTNAYPFTAVVNLPLIDWTPETLDCLKTENFMFTGDFDLKSAGGAIDFPMTLGFPPNKASHLVGISGPSTPWRKEADMTTGAGLESTVLFALDQYCLIGYQPQSRRSGARSFMIP